MIVSVTELWKLVNELFNPSDSNTITGATKITDLAGVEGLDLGDVILRIGVGGLEDGRPCGDAHGLAWNYTNHSVIF